MKQIDTFCILWLATLASFPASPPSAGVKLKVLVVTGGHGFDQEPFFKSFRRAASRWVGVARRENHAWFIFNLATGRRLSITTITANSSRRAFSGRPNADCDDAAG